MGHPVMGHPVIGHPNMGHPYMGHPDMGYLVTALIGDGVDSCFIGLMYQSHLGWD
jgi:hypothetical protein